MPVALDPYAHVENAPYLPTRFNEEPINWDVALGMAEAMQAESLKREPAAMLSSAVVGIRGKALIVKLPGATGTVRENLAVLLPAIPHAVEMIHGKGGVCTGST